MSPAPPTPPPAPARSIALFTLTLALSVVLIVGLARTTPTATADAPIDTGYRISVNHADPDTLALLPGVGPSIARNIVGQRETSGPFNDAAQLEDVRMIGPVLRQRIEPWVSFKMAPRPAVTASAEAPAPADADAAPR